MANPEVPQKEGVERASLKKDDLAHLAERVAATAENSNKLDALKSTLPYGSFPVANDPAEYDKLVGEYTKPVIDAAIETAIAA